jgi:hypothetical protein
MAAADLNHPSDTSYSSHPISFNFTPAGSISSRSGFDHRLQDV